MSAEKNLNFCKIYEFDTILHADSVEWCPHEPNQHLFVCANYQLEENHQEKTSKRIGRIHLFSISQHNLKLHQTLEVPGVLDQKWCHQQINGSSILGVANAENGLQIYRLLPEICELELITSTKNDESGVLMLSLDWSTGKYDSDEPKIVTSDSEGYINVFVLKNGELLPENRWKAHDFEAWICAFDYWDTNIIYSGGDDCKLLKHDLRAGTNPVVTNRTFTAGVTCLHSNKLYENILASGSYDENLILWDVRKMKNDLFTLCMPGCVWRLKWNPKSYKHLLVACMRNGFHTVKMMDDNNLGIVGSYYEHTDLSYGCDWCFLEDVSDFDGDGDCVVGACSFYDHKLTVAKVLLNEK